MFNKVDIANVLVLIVMSLGAVIFGYLFCLSLQADVYISQLFGYNVSPMFENTSLFNQFVGLFGTIVTMFIANYSFKIVCKQIENSIKKPHKSTT